VPLTFRQGAAAQLTKHKRFQRSFELSEGDVRLPKLFKQTVPQRWPGGGKTVVTELVAWSLDQARSIVSRLQRTAASGGINQL